MLLYSTSITPRLQYIVDFCSPLIAGSGMTITDNKDFFIQSEETKINYSAEVIEGNILHIIPHYLLFEKCIKKQETECFVFENQKAFFKTNGDFPFDIFAAIFYLMSRYEEYLPHEKDAYGRFAHTHSIAGKEGFLHLPLVNIWLQELVKTLQQKFTNYTPPNLSFSFVPTYDIDEAFSFRYKSFWRNAGGATKDFLRGKWKKINLRLQVLRQQINDPYHSFDWIDALNKKYQLQPVYFFLVAKNRSRFDKNISPHKKAMQEILKAHCEKYKVGIHPSWQSGDDESLLQEELQVLESIGNQKITHSRQHYIRFTLPETYRTLLAAGITFDFSMGYGSINGFRASVASPFYWYDLEKEESTALLLYPFCVMDANSFYEENLTASAAVAEMKKYLQAVKNVNGCFISIWHNTFLGTDAVFAGWREAYEDLVKEAVGA
ncbi:MAG: polysaccharide deacetylase family protein [Chitinophagaceae bacterium]|nr:polysaccharide deacetylase family protein [Chitinophagaceae bacterium]